MPVPCVAASPDVIAAVTPLGQSRFKPGSGRPGARFKKRMATSPAESLPPGSGVYESEWPEPVGTYANFDASSGCPP